MEVFQPDAKYPNKVNEQQKEPKRVLIRNPYSSIKWLLKSKLMEIYSQLYPKMGDKSTACKIFQTRISHIIMDAMSWKCLLNSLITNDEDKNTAMITNALKAFEILSDQIWDQDLWVLLCENISEGIKDETQYRNIIEVVLLSALNEKVVRQERIANVMSLFSDNPWFIMCKNIIPLLKDPFQKCYFTFLFLGLSGQQKMYIYNYFQKYPWGAPKKVRNNNVLLSALTVTQKSWMNLFQATNLLQRKRELLRLLLVDGDEPTAAKSNVEVKEEQISETGAAITVELNKVKIEQNTQACTSCKIEAELTEVKQELNADVSDAIGVKQELNAEVSDAIGVKQEKCISTFASLGQENYKEENIDQACDDMNSLDQKNTKKGENNTDNVNEEATSHAVAPILPHLKIKSEQSWDDAASIGKIADNQVETPNNTLQKELLTLDKLILNFSYQEINRRNSAVILNEVCISISDDDDDNDDDCIINDEEKNIEVPQLMNMYCKIVSDEQGKIVKNPLADVNYVQFLKEKRAKYIDEMSQKHEDYVVPHGSSTVLEKSSSSSIKSKPSKTQMTHKILNKMRRNRTKTNANVKKLFEQLRNESRTSHLAENTIVVIDDASPDVLDETITANKTLTSLKRIKRKVSSDTLTDNNKKARYSKSVPDVSTAVVAIEIEDTNSVTPTKSSTVHCSTPIANKHDADLEFIPMKSNNSKPNTDTAAIQSLNSEIANLTKEINSDSYLTIDLTSESLNCSAISKAQNTVIDLDKTTDNADCTVVVSDSCLSISGESDVTVLNIPSTSKQQHKTKQMSKFIKNINKLDSTEKGKLLELITEKIFNGCNVVNKKKSSLHNMPREASTRAPETAEDTYIKEVILGQTASRNSIGSNIYNPERDIRHKKGLRMIVIDGSNVAMEHGRGKVFSVKGLKICIDYFLKRGHVVKAFVPRFRCKFGSSTDPRLLDQLERDGLVVYTPSREIQGRRITSYDDRYIVQCAAEFDGVIVSGDNYRDLHAENPRWRFIIENRLLMPTWVQDMIMFPKDPLGRNGPTLEQFLRHSDPPRTQQIYGPSGSRL